MKKKHTKRIILLLLLLLFVFFMHMTGIREKLTLATFKEQSATITDFVANHYGVSVVLFIFLVVLVVTAGIPVSIILNIVAGYFFGLLPGAVYTAIGSTLGATTAFCSIRYLSRAVSVAQRGATYQRLMKGFRRYGASYLLAMQLFPLTPYALLIAFAATSGIPLFTFIWTTFFGIFPGCLIYAYAGKQLITIDSVGDVLSWPIILALSLMALFALVPVLVRKVHGKK